MRLILPAMRPLARQIYLLPRHIPISVHTLFPLLHLLLTYLLVQNHLDARFDAATRWAPAFPAARVRFITSLIALGLWGMLLPVWVPVYVVFGRACGCGSANRAGYHRVGASENEADLERSSKELSVQKHRRRALSAAIRWLPESRFLLVLIVSAYISFLIFAYTAMWSYAENPADSRFRHAVTQANREPRREGYGTGEKIFLAAMFYNNAEVVPYWTAEVIKAINYFGPDNVFVSIVESHSGDNTADLLESFDVTLTSLDIPHRVLTRDTSIERPPGPVMWESKPGRIEYIAAVRNLAMQPLLEMSGYTRVVFSNDVFIEAESIVELVHTREGDYNMVCGMDFGPWGLYDQWVARDRLGNFVSSVWPYLMEQTGYQAVKSDEPAPVFACWNGIAAFHADPFLPIPLRSGKQLSATPLSAPLPQTHPELNSTTRGTSPALTSPLRFRASAPGECFSAECFLLPYDFQRQFGLTKIYMNPRVINAYQWDWYVWFKYVSRHWLVMWWIRTFEDGAGMYQARVMLGDPAKAEVWDGGDCMPRIRLNVSLLTQSGPIDPFRLPQTPEHNYPHDGAAVRFIFRPIMPRISEAGKAKLDAILTDAFTSKSLPAMFLGVADVEGPIYMNAVGTRWFEDPSSGDIDVDTVFTIFSQTKLITTIALLQQIEQGKISFDTALEEIVPQYANPVILTGEKDEQGKATWTPARGKILIGHLLNHSSGLDGSIYAPAGIPVPEGMWPSPTTHDYKDEPDPKAKYFYLLNGSGELPGPALHHEPGTDFSYGISSDAAGFVVEALSGKTLEQYFKDHIFCPLGITAPSFHRTPELAANFLPIHLRTPAGTFVRWTAPPVVPFDEETGEADNVGIEVKLMHGGAGIYSSQKDYLKILQHILRIKTRRDTTGLLSPSSVDLMFEPTLPPLGAKTISERMSWNPYLNLPAGSAQYSHGLVLFTEDLPGKRRKGTGAWGGLAMTSYFMDPTTGIAVIFGTQILPPRDKVYEKVYGEIERTIYDAIEG
ncbi:unnamed protein product [Mycena citricolor]|uniref:Beta-lactamase-related domain-containing protein n=1 Tax=Mycena citricolor TaxID=2018698 RepID=A0AAD2I202_9AGAR|nr:unnamed protein product [Mycena citricolor]